MGVIKGYPEISFHFGIDGVEEVYRVKPLGNISELTKPSVYIKAINEEAHGIELEGYIEKQRKKGGKLME